MSYNLPSGVQVSDLPGCTPESERWDRVWRELEDIFTGRGLTADEAISAAKLGVELTLERKRQRAADLHALRQEQARRMRIENLPGDPL